MGMNVIKITKKYKRLHSDDYRLVYRFLKIR